jgi:hypothetical protein
MNFIKVILILLLFPSCFIGADHYEKGVNDQFWLYSISSNSGNVCLGTIDEKDYRFTDSYICNIKKIGWDNNFIIIQLENQDYYIQDLEKIKKLNNSKFINFLYGPFNKIQFDQRLDSFDVDANLAFTISY